MKIRILLFILLTCSINFAQKDSLKKSVSFSGYIESYYAYDFANPSNHNRPGFIYSFNRHNEINLNLGFLKAAYETNKVRSNLALMTGTYSNANLANEPGVFKNIFEANIGVKISKSKNLWFDAGIFPSHIGFESAIGKDCWNVTRSILADNSPYYESGAKISFINNNEKWILTALLLNGWQRIQRLDGNNAPAFGHQITFKPNTRFTFNSSSFVGSDTPDSLRKMRYFHNFYSQIQLKEKFGIIVGFDFGAQQKNKKSKEYDFWYSPVLILKYSPKEKIDLSLRGEYYSDQNQVMIKTNTANGFQTIGYSMNFDYKIEENVLWRLEARALESKDEIFILNNKDSKSNYFFVTTLAVSF